MPLVLEDYFRTMFEDRMLDKLPAKKDSHFATPATRLLEIRREMAEVELALSSQKEEFKTKMEGLRLRREELEQKELLLRKSLEKFEKFLKENDSKRARALKKADDERALKRRKEGEIISLYKETKEMVSHRNRLRRELATHRMFYEYMANVVEATDEFRESREILARFDTLTAIRQELSIRQQANFDAMEAQRIGLQQFIEEKEEEKLNCNLRLAELQLRKDKALSSVVKSDAEWTQVSSERTRRTIVIGSLLLATDNLYDLLLQYKVGRPTSADEDYREPTDAAGKLVKVKEFILDLTDITAANKRQSMAAPHPCAGGCV